MPKREQKPFVTPTMWPTQEGPFGIRFDYQQGFRLSIDKAKYYEQENPLFDNGVPYVRAWDTRTGTMLADQEISSEEELPDFRVVSAKKYFLPVSFEVLMGGERIFRHDFSLAGRKVLILMPEGTIGDIIAWMPSVIDFQREHRCSLTVRMSSELLPLFQRAYPQLRLVDSDDACNVHEVYATYYIGLFVEDKERLWNPYDYKITPLPDICRHILDMGRQHATLRPFISLDFGDRPVAEPYVCIAAQSTCAAKMWLNPYGWMQTIAQLKADGYRVICIDKSLASGDGIMWNFMPPGAEDQTGERPLEERARWLRHCEFFVGLSSGLSWLAWALGKKVVMISGFTHPSTEFYTPFRVQNQHACNSCWNRHVFDNQDFLWCPDHKNTPRHFECSHSITAYHVMQVIRTIPGYRNGPSLWQDP